MQPAQTTVSPFGSGASASPFGNVPSQQSQPTYGSGYGSSYGKPPKKGANVGLIIGVVVGLAVFIGIIVVVLIFALGGDKIKNIKDLRKAMSDQKAVNCTMTKDGDSSTIQANDGWTKVRMSSKTSNYLYLKDDGVYIWSSGDKTGYKMKDSSSSAMSGDNVKEEAKKAADSSDSNDDGYELKCESNSKANFDKPSDITFKDYDELINSYKNLNTYNSGSNYSGGSNSSLYDDTDSSSDDYSSTGSNSSSSSSSSNYFRNDPVKIQVK